MRNLAVLVYYDDRGRLVTRSKVRVLYASGEEDRRKRHICFEFGKDENGFNQAIYITPAALEKATGLIVREREGR